MDFILIVLFLGLFVGCPYVIWRTARKSLRLRNLQLKNAEMQHQQYTNPQPQPQPQQQLPGWYPDGNGGQRYWDGRAWAPPQGQVS